MKALSELHDDMRVAYRSIPITRESLLCVERACDHNTAEFIKSLNGDHKDVNSTSIVFCNVEGSGGPGVKPDQFRVVAIFGNTFTATNFVATQRPGIPLATYRVLELFEGKFSAFHEYAPAAEMQEEAA